jgi:hypothetical protein
MGATRFICHKQRADLVFSILCDKEPLFVNPTGDHSVIRHLSHVLIVITILSGCVNTPAQFKPAGFQTTAEVREYLPNYLYYAKKLTNTEWESFYRRFPEYWKDIQTSKQVGSSVEFHPWYTAYSFKWNTLRRKETWDSVTLARLELGDVRPGDDLFKIIVGRGVPPRVIWDNDFELLLYNSGNAMVFEDGVLARIAVCPGCATTYDNSSREGMLEDDVVNALSLQRPKY